ncbi:MAG TPA: hypothetical protein VF363_06870 [Candidatus Eisenbacteria bacterium]
MRVEQPESEGLLARVERLERQNRTLKVAGSIAILGAASALLLGAATPNKSLETDMILIKDAKGTTRMILGMADEGPAITMLDEKGRLRANIGVNKDGPEFDFLDDSETPRVQILLDGKQVPRFNMVNEKGEQVSVRP